MLQVKALIKTYYKPHGIPKILYPYNHHCENPVLGDFSVSSPNFFSARVWGGVLPLLGAEGPQKCCSARRRRAVYEKFRRFEKFLLKNAIKMILGDFLQKIFLNFAYDSFNVFSERMQNG